MTRFKLWCCLQFQINTSRSFVYRSAGVFKTPGFCNEIIIRTVHDNTKEQRTIRFIKATASGKENEQFEILFDLDFIFKQIPKLQPQCH